MRITYTDHAIARMETRRISKSDVQRVLRFGIHGVQEDGRDAKTLEVGGRTIRVPYEKEGPNPWTLHVVTVIVE